MDTTTLALVVAALGVASGPFTAWLGHRWSRRSEADRWRGQEDARRIQRGEQAAEQMLTMVDTAAIAQRQTETVTQSNYLSVFYDIRRLAELLTDDKTKSRMLDVADAIYYYNQAREAVPELARWSVTRAYQTAAHDVLHAYLQGRPCPETPRLTRLSGFIAEGSAIIADMLDEENDYDPLDEPDGVERVG